MATKMFKKDDRTYASADGWLIIQRESGRLMIDENNQELTTNQHWVYRNAIGEAFGVDWNVNDLAERHNLAIVH